jgi:hypothetical protein
MAEESGDHVEAAAYLVDAIEDAKSDLEALRELARTR